jgi:tetratricopeptide (TPR) repeat protein
LPSATKTEFIDAWLGIAYCLEELERYAEAIHHYRKAEKLDTGENIDIMLSISMCEYKLGNLDAAYFELQKVIDMDPNDLQLWEEWSDMLAENENIEGAITFLEEGIKHNPQAFTLYYRKSGYLFQLKKEAKALVMLENALLLSTDFIDDFWLQFPELVQNEKVRQLVRQYFKPLS